MDVHYKVRAWQDMKDGLNRLTKDTFVNLRQANNLVNDIQERIQELDSDGSIYFHHKDQLETIGKLHNAYTDLETYCDQAGQVVNEHIDKPFLVKMDKFTEEMRDLSIKNFETTNRIGSTTTTTVPGSNSYGSTPQTITTTKPKITVDDIFKDSHAFDEVLRAEYKEIKENNPNAKLDYEEYRKLVPSTRGFEYTSIEDDQKKLETWRDFGITGAILVTTVVCAPLGFFVGVTYSIVQGKSAYDGEDWGTHRKLSQDEQVERAFFSCLDIFLSAGTMVKGLKATTNLGLVEKLQDGATGFNPNAGKNVVQLFQGGKNIKLDNLSLNIEKKTSVENAPVFEKKSAEFFDGLNLKSDSKDLELKESTKGNLDFKEWEDMPVGGQTRLTADGLRIMNIRDLKKFKKDMNEIGIKIILDKKEKILPRNVAGGFDPYTEQMVLRTDASLLSALHESYHAKQFRELGQENYLKQSRSEREEYVYNEIMKNKEKFIAEEIYEAQRYIFFIRNKQWPLPNWKGYEK
ncbi:zincin-like metallopeptidase toxin domain-containing protein [Bacillus pseudomycoides]|uniref:zincin-like metallopeptidase toxin domain-containing protein n=1 Tax=Bacillus pseudomycoides TaxID=64104 RepID=UPI001F0ACB27|nr:zincin-like metallopeptidase toxin domain-containing protein [Bacillus pseudomycoides]